MRLLSLCLALLIAACGSSSKPSTTSGKSASSKKVKKKKKKPPVDTAEVTGEDAPPPGDDEPTEKVVKKKKKKPFEPAPLESLADRGELKAKKLGKPASKLDKLCPKKKQKTLACSCPAMGEPSTPESWEPNAASCSAAVEGLEAPFANVQLLGLQKTVARKNDTPDISAAFQLLLQTKKGLFSADLGSITMAPGVGYSGSFALKSRSFVDLIAGGNQELMAVVEQTKTTVADGGERTTETTGWLLVCSAADPKKISCTPPISLGESRGDDGGYQLEPIVEGNALYLRETTAKTPEELAKAAGKYTLVL
jgi:hypothetical protein